MKFCDEVFRRRTDGRYCWLTGSPHPAVLTHVKGLAAATRMAYEVEYDSNPDDTEFEFVDGVGITSYAYHHHGSVADTEVHLVEFHPDNSANR